jgi:hypothetical protein
MSRIFLDSTVGIAHTNGMARSGATPIHIGSDNLRSPLERIRLGQGVFNEGWLQELIHDHPAILPISDIEPGFGELIAAAREVPCGHGFIDNLYLTPSGEIVLVETKLWRNSQMRREVVAQALDYIAALGSMPYDTFETAVYRGQKAPAKLYDLVRNHPEALEEAAFIDAIADNLRRGRMLAIVLGDGIRTETEALSHLLQSHAGAHFTFALVELATWKNAMTGDILAVPNTLAKTVMIERGIVRVEQGLPVVCPVPTETRATPQTITSADFWDKLAEQDPTLPSIVRSFLAVLEPLGIFPEIRGSLNIKVDLPNREKPVNFGYIQKNGQFVTHPASWGVPEHAWRPYFDKLAALIDGQVVIRPAESFVSTDGASLPRVTQFLPQHQNALVAAIETMLRTLSAE